MDSSLNFVLPPPYICRIDHYPVITTSIPINTVRQVPMAGGGRITNGQAVLSKVLEQWPDSRGSARGLHAIPLPEVSTPRSLHQPLGESREATASERAVPEVPQRQPGRSLGRPYFHEIQVRLLSVSGLRGLVHGIRTLIVYRAAARSIATLGQFSGPRVSGEKTPSTNPINF